MASKAGGKGEARDPETITVDGTGEETAEEHEANIRAKLRDEADALVASAESAVEKTKAHAAGAAEALKEAKAHRAGLGDK